jgi:hypothetical protein
VKDRVAFAFHNIVHNVIGSRADTRQGRDALTLWLH